MSAKLGILVLTLAASLALSGCAHKELFSSLDHCYLADWTNHHSYLSCCCPDGGSCPSCQPGAVH